MASIEYRLQRSKRKSIALSVDATGIISVKAPRLLPLYIINQFVTSKEKWIISTRDKILSRTTQHPTPKLTENDIKLIKKEFRSDIGFVLTETAQHMNLNYNKLKLTSAQTRWGSCSTNGNINLNWRLALVPSILQKYVVIHELAHLEHMDHSKAFWQLVSHYDPQYKQHRNALHNYSHFLNEL